MQRDYCIQEIMGKKEKNKLNMNEKIKKCIRSMIKMKIFKKKQAKDGELEKIEERDLIDKMKIEDEVEDIESSDKTTENVDSKDLSDAMKIQKEIDDTEYTDSEVISVECNYFADEVKIIYEENQQIEFMQCYKVEFEHILEYDKERPIRFYTTGQLMYWLQNIEVKKNGDMYNVSINMFPLYINIQCKEIIVYKEKIL